MKLGRDGTYKSDMYLNLEKPFENVTEYFLKIYVAKTLVHYIICKYVYGNLNAKMETRSQRFLY